MTILTGFRKSVANEKELTMETNPKRALFNAKLKLTRALDSGNTIDPVSGYDVKQLVNYIDELRAENPSLPHVYILYEDGIEICD